MSQGDGNAPPPTAPQTKLSSGSPPPYTEYAATAPDPSATSSAPHASPLPPNLATPFPVPMFIANSGPHPGYGPTPLTTNQPLLPYAYYAPRMSADSRARRRFFGAFFCAIGLWLLFGFLIGVQVLGEQGWVRRGWVWFGHLDGVVRYWLKLKVSNGATSFD